MNKLRIIVAFLLGLCVTEIAAAQDVLYSPYEKYDQRGGDFAVVGKVNGLLYTYRASSEGFFLDAFNDSMARVATVILDFFPSKIYETRFIPYANKIMVLYQAVETGKVVQYAALLDETGRLLKKPIALASAKTGWLGPTRDYFSSVVSDDKKSVVIYAAYDKGSELTFDGTMIDDELNVQQKQHAVYHGDNTISHGEAILGNDRTFYLPVFTATGSKNFADQLWLLALPTGANKFNPTEFPLDGMFAASSYMRMDNVNNRIYIGGFYSDKKAGNYEGVLFGYYDVATQSIQHRKMILFDAQLRAATSDKNKKRAFNDFVVRQLIVRNDGGFVLVSEDYYMTIRNATYAPGWGYYSMYYYGPYSMPSIREYNYNDILALAYNAEGTREWSSFVRKSQYSQEDGGMFSSYALLNTGGTLGFLYNDYNTNQSRIQLATIDGAGQVNMRSMAAEGNAAPDWLPRSGKQVAAREMVIPCFRKRQICFAKIVF